MAKARTDVPGWVRYWFLLSGLIVIWDAAYCLTRPHSFEGGSLAWLFGPYKLYGKVDLIYSRDAFLKGDGFCAAQALLNLVEVTLQFLALKLWRSSNANTRLQGNFVGYSAQLLTLAKTVLYWLQDILGGFKHTGHNTVKDMVLLYWIPNGAWIVIPAITATILGRKVLGALSKGGKAY